MAITVLLWAGDIEVFVFGGPTFRVIRTCEELPKSPPFHNHWTLTSGANLIRPFLGIPNDDLSPLIPTVLLRVSAFGIGRASQEKTLLPPSNHHGTAAPITGDCTCCGLPLCLGNERFSSLEIFTERAIEILHRLGPVDFFLFNSVQDVLHPGRKLDIQNAWKTPDQEIGYEETHLGRFESPLP